MKLFFVSALLLVAGFFSTTSAAAPNTLCLICSPFFTVPKEWSGAQNMLKAGCEKLGPAKNACEGLVMAADLTSSYSNMYPHILTLKDIGCKKYCA